MTLRQDLGHSGADRCARGRYLQHVPPAGQHRVRYFGWMHPSAKLRRMQVETLLQKPIVLAPPPTEAPRWHLRCPHCARVVAGTARRPGTRAGHPPLRVGHARGVAISALPRSVTLVRVGALPRQARAPPRCSR